MNISLPILIHLLTVLPALIIGAVNLYSKKGTPSHKFFGRVWVVFMLVASITSFFIQSNGTYSWIHILSVVSIVNVVLGFWAIYIGNLRMHKGCIVGAYTGSLVAGIFAVMLPGRISYVFLFGV